ncbi:MAG: acyl-CoA dehydrogenase family protein [Acidimicrobiales bacterium]
MATTTTAPDAALSADESAEFRARCVAFLDEYATGIHLGGDPDPRAEKRLRGAQAFQQELADAGLAGITYPKEHGGQGLTKAHDRIWREEYSKYPFMTSELTISHGMCLPMLAEYGSEDQKVAYLADNIAARTVWCQMFSEPGAGSDVASLQSRAERDGDEWILNGQKVWTTLAHLCEYGIVIARTDPDQPKHAGISMFIVDMKAPGVEVRPIIQVDGGRHFNEVFFSDVRIPAENLIGDLNNGWRLATAMLMYERVAIGGGSTDGVVHAGADALIIEADERGLLADPVLRDDLMRLYVEESVRSMNSLRSRAELKAGKTPGPAGSLGKLQGTLVGYLLRDLSMRIVGADGLAWEGESGGKWATQAIRVMGMGIAGGTNEIQKNIIGDRVLGLPRDISVDKNLPFKELKVGTQRE